MRLVKSSLPSGRDGSSTAAHLAPESLRRTAPQVESRESRSPGPSSTVMAGRTVATSQDTRGEKR